MSVSYKLRNWHPLEPREVGAVRASDRLPTAAAELPRASSKKNSQPTVYTLFISLCSPEATGKMNLPFRAGLCRIPSDHIHTSPFYTRPGMQAARDSEVSESAYDIDCSFLCSPPLPLEVEKGGQGALAETKYVSPFPKFLIWTHVPLNVFLNLSTHAHKHRVSPPV